MTKAKKRKRCSICRSLKPFSEFSPCKTGKHGLYNYCKECRNNRLREAHPDRKKIDEKKSRRDGLKKLGLKTCTSCGDIKPLEDFYGDPRHTDGKQTLCKECFNQKGDANYLRKEYGLSTEEFNELMDYQDGTCAICGRPPKNNKFNVDHDHKTGKIRALLCVNCNTNLLPIVENYPDWVRAAFDYLEHPPAFKVIGERIVPETNQHNIKQKKPR